MKTLKILIRLALWQGIGLLFLVYTGTRLPSAKTTAVLPAVTPIMQTISPIPTLSQPARNAAHSAAGGSPPSPFPQSTISNNELTNNELTSSICIITVDGGRYDVTTFRNIHSGGDVFTCGADMSAIFHGQHDAETLQKFQIYRIN